MKERRRTCVKGMETPLIRRPRGGHPCIADRFWRGRQAAQVSGSGIGLAVTARFTRGRSLILPSLPGAGPLVILGAGVTGG